MDKDAAACETYGLNLPEVRLYLKQLKDIVHMQHEDLKVDIMHISPPCQTYSLVNKNPNPENDILNIAANMEIGNCLDSVRPRIATVEQTSGFFSQGHVRGKHSENWGKFVEQFTSRGYSVAWKNIQLAELGLAQTRLRLIMIASW